MRCVPECVGDVESRCGNRLGFCATSVGAVDVDDEGDFGPQRTIDEEPHRGLVYCFEWSGIDCCCNEVVAAGREWW